MFIPNSPSPPSGMAHTDDWLNLSFFRVRPTFLIYGRRIASRHAGTAPRAGLPHSLPLLQKYMLGTTE
jgi:hypothetical protein